MGGWGDGEVGGRGEGTPLANHKQNTHLFEALTLLFVGEEEAREGHSRVINTLSAYLEGAGPVSSHRCCFVLKKPETGSS